MAQGAVLPHEGADRTADAGAAATQGTAADSCGSGREDYLQVTLTDTDELIDPVGPLRSVYPNVLQILLEKNETVRDQEYVSRLSGPQKGIEDLFADFYELVKGEPLDQIRKGYV